MKWILPLAMLTLGCNGADLPAPGQEKAMSKQSSGTVENLLVEVEALPEGVETFELFVPANLTLQEQPIAQNMAMSIVLDKLLSKELYPVGFDEKPTGRLYKYKKEASE